MSWISALGSYMKTSSRAAWKASKRIAAPSTLPMAGCVLIGSLLVGHVARADRSGPVTLDGSSQAQSITWPAVSEVVVSPITSDAVASAANTPTPAEQTIYRFPVQPAAATQYGPGHHDYPAVDIFAPKDSLFVSPVAGRIDELSREDHWSSKVDDPALRGGRFVSIVGDDGVRYYGSHLDAVATGLAAGMRVEPGQILGYVGTSGNARGGKPQLHFGISYPTFPGDWQIRRGIVSPYPYLKAWERGENVTPVVKPEIDPTQVAPQGGGAPVPPIPAARAADNRR